ncbi:hypothetical protein EDD18DRAFT_1113418 [Armillaria luteobubalina]|uniref:Uncharacterized protein n=1 Tax=Armillaria luteobubalina TaxID=153913 RepID=A0AA39PB58_9AGAR|nr:hypothetical protein EDD18DRAFT_1113418 [Armillaria luteobubalina]
MSDVVVVSKCHDVNFADLEPTLAEEDDGQLLSSAGEFRLGFGVHYPGRSIGRKLDDIVQHPYHVVRTLSNTKTGLVPGLLPTNAFSTQTQTSSLASGVEELDGWNECDGLGRSIAELGLPSVTTTRITTFRSREEVIVVNKRGSLHIVEGERDKVRRAGKGCQCGDGGSGPRFDERRLRTKSNHESARRTWDIQSNRPHTPAVIRVFRVDTPVRSPARREYTAVITAATEPVKDICQFTLSWREIKLRAAGERTQMTNIGIIRDFDTMWIRNDLQENDPERRTERVPKSPQFKRNPTSLASCVRKGFTKRLNVHFDELEFCDGGDGVHDGMDGASFKAANLRLLDRFFKPRYVKHRSSLLSAPVRRGRTPLRAIPDSDSSAGADGGGSGSRSPVKHSHIIPLRVQRVDCQSYDALRTREFIIPTPDFGILLNTSRQPKRKTDIRVAWTENKRREIDERSQDYVSYAIKDIHPIATR